VLSRRNSHSGIPLESVAGSCVELPVKFLDKSEPDFTSETRSGQSNIFGAIEENSSRRSSPPSAYQQSCETVFRNPHGGTGFVMSLMGTKKLQLAGSPNLHSAYTGIAENIICG
jgi:hypothetical protein